MNRSIAILLVLIVIVALGIGLLVFFSTRSAAPPDQLNTPSTNTGTPNSTVSVTQQRSKTEVRAAYQEIITKNPGDNTELYDTSIVGEYALQVWAGDTMGGEALLKYDPSQRKWNILSGGGGQWSVETLVTLMNVPQDTAVQLLAGLGR